MLKRKLFGGYRIVPKPCRPEGATEQDELGICMFNYECAAREGEVVGACMDGFLFGACCRLPSGHTFELPDPELILDGSATFPPDNVNSIVATSKRPDNMESSSISEILNNPQHHVAMHPEADTVLIDRPTSATNRPLSHSELSTFSYVDNNNVEEQSSTPKYNPEEKSTMPVTPTYYSTGSKWTTRPWPPPTSSYVPLSSANNFEEGLVLVPTITVSSNNINKRPDPSPEPGGPDPESINHIISLLNDSSTGLIDPGPEPEPEIISLDNSSPPGLSTWVSVNGRPSASTSWRPDSTSYTKIPTHSKPPTHRPSYTSSQHIVGPAYEVATEQDQGSRPAPTLIVLGPLSSEPTSKTPTTKRPNIITSTNKLPTTSVTLVTKRPSSKPSPGFFITKRPSSTAATFAATRPRPTQSTTQYTNRPTIITQYDKPVTHYDHPSTQYERPTTQYTRPSTQYDRPTTPYDRPTTQFLYRPTTSSTIRPPSTTYYTYPPSTYITQRPTSSSGITHLTNRPPGGTIFVTNRPSSHRPSSGTTLVSNRPWTTTPMEYPDTTLPADHLANFPPVRNPSFNTTQHERPPVVLPPNPEDLFNVDDLPTPVFQEDDKLNSKLQVFVDKLVQSLDGNFQDLEDVLIDGGNFTSSTFVSTTKRPATRPTSRRPTQTTAKPTRRPTSGSTPVRRTSTTVRPTSRPSQSPKPRPTSRPSSVRPTQTRPSQSTRPSLSTRPSTRPTSKPTLRPIQTSRPSTRPTQTTRPPQKVSSVKPSTRPRPTRPNTTLRPSSTNKAPTTKRSTTTSSTTQLLVQQDETIKPAKTTTTTTEEPSTFQENNVPKWIKISHCHTFYINFLKKLTFWTSNNLVTRGNAPKEETKPERSSTMQFLANLVAVFGEFDISGELESRRSVTKNVRRVIVHRQYDAATFANDLALLELESPVAFDKHIVPICMPKDKEDFTGRMATVTGWGRLKYGGGVPNLLQEVQVPVIENAVCQEMFHTAGHNKVILNSFLCAGYANGQKDSCEVSNIQYLRLFDSLSKVQDISIKSRLYSM
ncbi:hypothetical protein C0J52_27372 [Blattella germanica]|nr:hypothetical protein C0J52_27372 [Blattella germanica]